MSRRHPYDWGTDPDDPWQPFAVTIARIRRFFAALADQGLHVGLGSPPTCATCRTDWPCRYARQHAS